MEDLIKKFSEYIEESHNIVFFGGAGVSTESGIPDFRSKDGLYNQKDIKFDKYPPEYLLSHTCLVKEPKVFFEFYRQKMDARNIQPNAAHFALAELEKLGKLKSIITQNIDGLHQKAGSNIVYEIHGTTKENYCDKCNKKYPSDYIFDSKESIPQCECGGIVRPKVTLYEEGLPEDAVSNAISAIRKADMLIVAGTSLQVYPAASYVHNFTGKHLVVINKEPINVKLDNKKDIFIQGSVGEILRNII
ncbi:NAD-dependent protein deacylase [Peptostreptococcus equinus]|uniref:protein acetyllysine N-acetyltransferase n=1 Tax=Peptostreptococcus equinus TaxID=3003601 RepID=A0ABY7JNQ7_9FIRM|nr:NAD-dependent protein deacylase [Peptostreptococcus sp. CBA3647]WAW15010.1 NAD-dependent protein deacylase [Peptostreptococcus sp. CBA3647]